MADIYCNACETRLGWKYVEAFEDSQKYKEGKFILEKAMIAKEEELRRREDEELTRRSALEADSRRSSLEAEDDELEELSAVSSKADADALERARSMIGAAVRSAEVHPTDDAPPSADQDSLLLVPDEPLLMMPAGGGEEAADNERGGEEAV